MGDLWLSNWHNCSQFLSQSDSNCTVNISQPFYITCTLHCSWIKGTDKTLLYWTNSFWQESRLIFYVSMWLYLTQCLVDHPFSLFYLQRTWKSWWFMLLAEAQSSKDTVTWIVFCFNSMEEKKKSISQFFNYSWSGIFWLHVSSPSKGIHFFSEVVNRKYFP